MPAQGRSTRELATVMFVDVVDSTDLVSALGDQRWVGVLDSLEAITAEVVAVGGGNVIKSTGDGSLLVLPNPSAALDCASSLHDRARQLGLVLRAGIHTGEIERRSDDIAGLAVHVAARLVGIATPGQTFVSETVRTLVAGATYPFEARGERRVKGIAEPVVVYAIDSRRAPDPDTVDEEPRGSGLEQLRRLIAAGRFEDAGGPAAVIDDTSGIADALLDARARTGFLDVDIALVRLLEDALERLTPDDAIRRSRVASKLAYELRGDAATLDRRRELLAEASAAASAAGDDRAYCDVGLATIHALWDPSGAHDRIRAAEELLPVVRRLGEVDVELEARLARVQALVEVGRVEEAELELATYARLAAPLRRQDLQAFVASRRAFLASIRGRYDELDRQAELARDAAVAAGMPDADRLWRTLRAATLMHRNEPRDDVAASLAMLREHLIAFPGNLFEATLAWALHGLGRQDDAAAELARALPTLLRSSGHRWLSAATELAHVAADIGTDAQCAALYDALLDKQDFFVVLGPRFLGAVRQYLGPLAARIGRRAESVEHLERAIADLDDMAALPWAATARVALADIVDADDPFRADRLRDEARAAARSSCMTRLLDSLGPAGPLHEMTVWTLRADDGSWVLHAGGEHARLRPSRGLEYLARLLGSPLNDIAASDLEAGTGASPVESRIEVLDDQARKSYRQRLAELDVALDAADQRGDQQRSATLEAERDELVAQLRAATGLGGRSRQVSDRGERARVNVTRAIKRAIEQITQTAPMAGAHLSRSIRTGALCRYEPGADAPDRWDV